MQAKYEAADYRLPQVVFWNLAASRIRGQKSTPVQVNEKGVALVSGFSGQLLKLFMDKPGSPEAWKVSHPMHALSSRPAATASSSFLQALLLQLSWLHDSSCMGMGEEAGMRSK